jgi:integrating conjugative element protein (TIGR03758 family)
LSWESEFQAGAGVDPGTLALLSASLVALAILLFVGWVGVTQYQGWRAGSQSAYQALRTLLVSTLLAMLIGFYIRP